MGWEVTKSHEDIGRIFALFRLSKPQEQANNNNNSKDNNNNHKIWTKNTNLENI
jgi:hypothetical protein